MCEKITPPDVPTPTIVALLALKVMFWKITGCPLGQGPFTSMKCGDTLAFVPVNDKFLIRVGPPVCLVIVTDGLLFTRMFVTPCPAPSNVMALFTATELLPHVQLPAGMLTVCPADAELMAA